MEEEHAQNGIVEAPACTESIRRYYDRASRLYFLIAAIEKKARICGLELARIGPGDAVLEVAVGIGHTFLEILKKVGREDTVCGVDISSAMLVKTRRLADKSGYHNFDLREGDARKLPFEGDSFDVLYNSYMLDLIPIDDLPVVLDEFYRVLRKGGRLVLVNLSKKGASPVFYERLYRISPVLLGGCRPVLMEPFVKRAGFIDVERKIMGRVLPTEIVTARK